MAVWQTRADLFKLIMLETELVLLMSIYIKVSGTFHNHLPFQLKKKNVLSSLLSQQSLQSIFAVSLPPH